MNKCQKCAKPAIVHLTEIITPGPDTLKPKQAVQIHLCVDHAVEAGLLTPMPDQPVPPASKQTASSPPPAKAKAAMGAIVPAQASVFTAIEPVSTPQITCPTCGMTWGQFKQSGILGCPNDYELFSINLLPLLHRAQEGAQQHVGKFPARQVTQESDRQITTHRLRRDLQKALEVEDYKQAAQLRDKLRSIEAG